MEIIVIVVVAVRDCCVGEAVWVKDFEINAYWVTRRLAHLLAQLTYLLAPHCSGAPLATAVIRSLACSLAPELTGKRYVFLYLMHRFHSFSP